MAQLIPCGAPKKRGRPQVQHLVSGLLISWNEDELGFELNPKKTSLATDGHRFTRISREAYLILIRVNHVVHPWL